MTPSSINARTATGAALDSVGDFGGGGVVQTLPRPG